MTPDEIRKIPTVNMQMKMQLEICAQTAELREAIVLLVEQNAALIKLLTKKEVSVKEPKDVVEDTPKKTERPTLK